VNEPVLFIPGFPFGVLATIAKERIRTNERVHAGLPKARKRGRIGGQPRLVFNRAKVMHLDEEGLTIREIAGEMGVASQYSAHFEKPSPPNWRSDSRLAQMCSCSSCHPIWFAETFKFSRGFGRPVHTHGNRSRNRSRGALSACTTRR
jgi:hypothetical protein